MKNWNRATKILSSAAWFVGRQEHNTPHPTHSKACFTETVHAGPVCLQGIQRHKRYSDAQYETRLALYLPANWCLSVHGYSLHTLYFHLRSVSNSLHFTEWVCTFAVVWTSILGIFLKLHICHYTHIDHKRCQFVCALSITKGTLLQNRVPSPLILDICINVILTVSTCTWRSCSEKYVSLAAINQ